MDKDTVLVPTGQEISDTPQQGRAVEHFNSEGRPLQAAPPPEGEAILVLVQPEDILDGPPEWG